MEAILAGYRRMRDSSAFPSGLVISKREGYDVLLVEGDPLADIHALRRVKGEMLNGKWVVEPPER